MDFTDCWIIILLFVILLLPQILNWLSVHKKLPQRLTDSLVRWVKRDL